MRETAGSAAAPAARWRKFRRGSFMAFALWNGGDATLSFRLNARRLDDRPPFLDLRFVEGSKPLGRLLLGRSHIQSEFGKARAHSRVCEGLRHRTVELCDDV